MLPRYRQNDELPPEHRFPGRSTSQILKSSSCTPLYLCLSYLQPPAMGSIMLEDRYCRAKGCGRTKCDHCSYCHNRGHTVHECPLAPPCKFCGTKGHKTEHCPNGKSAEPVKSGHGRPPRRHTSSLRLQPREVC